MIKHFLSKLSDTFRFILYAVFFVAFCFAVSYIFVKPVWYSAVTWPKAYSAVVLSFFLILFLYKAVKRIRSKLSSCASALEKKEYAVNLTANLCRIIAALTALTIIVKQVLSGERLFALFTVVAFTAVMLLISFITGTVKQKIRKNETHTA